MDRMVYVFFFIKCIADYRQDSVRVQFGVKRMFLSRKERANDIATDKPIYMVTENVGNVSCLVLYRSIIKVFLRKSHLDMNLFLTQFFIILVRITIFLMVHIMVNLNYTSTSFLFQA